MENNKRCGECGSKQLELRDQMGKPFPWKDYPAVMLNRSWKALECKLCGNTVVNAGQLKALDKAIEETLLEDITYFIETVLQREGINVTELARHIGLSREYLSTLKSGKIPKYQTYNLLKILSVNEGPAFEVSNPTYEDFRKKLA